MAARGREGYAHFNILGAPDTPELRQGRESTTSLQALWLQRKLKNKNEGELEGACFLGVCGRIAGLSSFYFINILQPFKICALNFSVLYKYELFSPSQQA